MALIHSSIRFSGHPQSRSPVDDGLCNVGNWSDSLGRVIIFCRVEQVRSLWPVPIPRKRRSVSISLPIFLLSPSLGLLLHFFRVFSRLIVYHFSAAPLACICSWHLYLPPSPSVRRGSIPFFLSSRLERWKKIVVPLARRGKLEGSWASGSGRSVDLKINPRLELNGQTSRKCLNGKTERAAENISEGPEYLIRSWNREDSWFSSGKGWCLWSKATRRSPGLFSRAPGLIRSYRKVPKRLSLGEFTGGCKSCYSPLLLPTSTKSLAINVVEFITRLARAVLIMNIVTRSWKRNFWKVDENSWNYGTRGQKMSYSLNIVVLLIGSIVEGEGRCRSITGYATSTYLCSERRILFGHVYVIFDTYSLLILIECNCTAALGLKY